MKRENLLVDIKTWIYDLNKLTKCCLVLRCCRFSTFYKVTWNVRKMFTFWELRYKPHLEVKITVFCTINNTILLFILISCLSHGTIFFFEQLISKRMFAKTPTICTHPSSNNFLSGGREVGGGVHYTIPLLVSTTLYSQVSWKIQMLHGPCNSSLTNNNEGFL